MARFIRRCACVFVTVALAGCGPAATSPLLVTCDARSATSGAAQGQCQEWRGDKAASTNASVDFDALCRTTVGGQVVQGDCATGAVGVCTKRPSVAERVVLHFYYAPTWDAAKASADCAAMKGTWAAK